MAAEGVADVDLSGMGWVRQWGRGRMAAEGGAQAGRQGRRSLASMGPRPDGRGRLGRKRHGLLGSWRQWGRGRMAAEGKYWLPGCPSATSRQWGRGRMAAEGRERAACQSWGGGASMGPRPDGRGRGLSCSLLRMWLGCVNGAAAGWPRKDITAAGGGAAQTSVNGAAAGWPRKAHAAVDLSDRLLASMGPRPDGRGRL